jgi:hypothetical protein
VTPVDKISDVLGFVPNRFNCFGLALSVPAKYVQSLGVAVVIDESTHPPWSLEAAILILNEKIHRGPVR